MPCEGPFPHAHAGGAPVSPCVGEYRNVIPRASCVRQASARCEVSVHATVPRWRVVADSPQRGRSRACRLALRRGRARPGGRRAGKRDGDGAAAGRAAARRRPGEHMTRLSAHDGHDTRAVGPAPFGSDTVFTFFSPVRHRSATSFRTSMDVGRCRHGEAELSTAKGIKQYAPASEAEPPGESRDILEIFRASRRRRRVPRVSTTSTTGSYTVLCMCFWHTRADLVCSHRVGRAHEELSRGGADRFRLLQPVKEVLPLSRRVALMGKYLDCLGCERVR